MLVLITLSTIITRIVTILYLLSLLVKGTLARPITTTTNTTTYPPFSTSFTKSSVLSCVAQGNSAADGAAKTYYLTIAGTTFTALGLCLSIITTVIAIINFRLKLKARVESHGQGLIGVLRNTINDEASREARDALTQSSQFEEVKNSNSRELRALSSTNTKVDICPPALPMPSERPSRSICHAEIIRSSSDCHNSDLSDRKTRTWLREEPSTPLYKPCSLSTMLKFPRLTTNRTSPADGLGL
ncbi:hypothetical protein F4805DRAFT_440776 [Annulohypoxylon moriforme]|nr:hypothetical protein F4805DRAFT_440776 [Annulohypoxylon moriforme]